MKHLNIHTHIKSSLCICSCRYVYCICILNSPFCIKDYFHMKFIVKPTLTNFMVMYITVVVILGIQHLQTIMYTHIYISLNRNKFTFHIQLYSK